MTRVTRDMLTNTATADAAIARYRDMLGLSYAPSAHQVGIFDWVTTGEGNAVVDSVAGSGKTTALECAVRLYAQTHGGEVMAVAFNREIAEVLGQRLHGTGAKTTTAHAHGLACVNFYCYARMGLNGAVKVEVDKSERKYPAMFTAAGDAILARLRAVAASVGVDEMRFDAALETGSTDEIWSRVFAAAGSGVTMCGRPLTADQLAAIVGDGFPVSECTELAKLARLFLLDFDGAGYERGLDLLARRYDVDVDETMWPLVVLAVQNALRHGCTPPSRGQWLIDFTDMIWLPTVVGMRPKQYDLVMVDECQDISTAARKLLIASVRRGGRMMWVGDRRQAINGFAGADSNSFDAIVRETRAQILPLSVCYRCPTLHLARAREWRPDILARPGAPAGTIRTLQRIDYVDEAARGDLVICRRTAPLIGLCFELIAAGTSATVRGRADMSKGLVKIIERASRRLRADDWQGGLSIRLGELEAAEADKIRARARDEQSAETAVEALNDRMECVRTIHRSSGAKSKADLVKAVERIFEGHDAAVVLSTVHRAKGLEADRVVILEHDRLISPRATQAWQIEQEENLAYVAWTRSKRDIIAIPAPKRGEP